MRPIFYILLRCFCWAVIIIAIPNMDGSLGSFLRLGSIIIGIYGLNSLSIFATKHKYLQQLGKDQNNEHQ